MKQAKHTVKVLLKPVKGTDESFPFKKHSLSDIETLQAIELNTQNKNRYICNDVFWRAVPACRLAW